MVLTALFRPTASMDACGVLLVEERVFVLDLLGPDKADPEVGRMYRVRYRNGHETDAFADELSDWRTF